MFAKIFESIYDGTLADNWQAMVTFQQMLILSDQGGVVDMTPAAIHRRTGIPTEIIEQGIAILEQPDPQSRSKDMEGRRIVRLDPHRDWGWFLVNHAQYREKINAAEKREADRVRIAAKRAEQSQPAPVPNATPSPPPEQSATYADVSQNVAECRGVSQTVADVAHTDAEVDTEAGKAKARAVGKKPATMESDAPSQSPASRACQAMIEAGVPKHRINHSHAALLDALAEGVTPQEFADAVPGALAAAAGNPFTWAIAVARGEHAKRGSPTPAGRRPGKPGQIGGQHRVDFESIDYGAGASG